MSTPIEWFDEPKRMSNIRDGVGCPHGRLDYCSTCMDLEYMAAQKLGLDPWEVLDSSGIPEGGVFGGELIYPEDEFE